LILRILSGIAGVVVFLIALVFSLGAAIAAPVGMLLVRRWTARHNRRSSAVASLFGAVLATSAAAACLLLVVFALAPRPTTEDLVKAARENQQQPVVKMPDWYTKAFPQTARTDSATQQLIRSPGFMTVTLVMGGAFTALLLGGIGGTLGWCGSRLFRIAWVGRAADQAVA